jgi:thiamine-monophosphate kinase
VTVSELTERELIARIQQTLQPAPPWLLVGIGDDGAVIEPERNRLEVFTADAIVEGIHFDRRFSPADAIGHRALAVNLSDLAAMGATPRLCLLSMALPPALPCADFDAIVSAIAAVARTHQIHVVGGNLTKSPGPLMIDVTAVGSVKRRGVMTRSGARPGDEVYITGTIGGGASGLYALQADPSGSDSRWAECIHRYLYPTPRVRAGVLLGRNRAASACMDLSDGAADAARQIADASAVGMILQADALPIHDGARAWFEASGVDPERAALRGGDDYELMFTVRPRNRGRLRTVATHSDVPITRVGVCTAGGGVRLQRTVGPQRTTDGDVDGAVHEEPLPAGFGHFR